MIYQLPKNIQFLFLFLLSTLLWSQTGIVKGVLNGDDGLPLPGVNITIKNTSKATATNFDGEYEIACYVGDVLTFSSIGMKTREILVTRGMLTGEVQELYETIKVKHIKSKGYLNAIKESEKNKIVIPDIESSEHSYNKKYYFGYDYKNIKRIRIDSNEVQLNYFNPNVFFEAGYNTTTGLKFVQKNNLPVLQNTFSQGISLNGDLVFQGAETGNLFSYGPKVANLEFDGSNYEYDSNGRLVALGNGNGKRAKLYDNNLFETSLKLSQHLFFNINTKSSFLGFDYTYKTEKDLYNIENNKAHLVSLKYNNSKNEKIKWNTFVKYRNLLDKQPNINGFQNNLLLNSWLTPVTFNNNEAYTLPSNIQRSFSPNAFNNPNWLLNNNQNIEKHTEFITSVKNTASLSNEVKLNTILDYKNTKKTQNFGLQKSTIGYRDGYFSDRVVAKNNFNGRLNFNYDMNTYPNEFEINSSIHFNHEDLAYQFNEFNNFESFDYINSINFIARDQSLVRNKVRLSTNARYSIEDIGLILFLANNSYISSIQNDKWFLPTLQFKLRFHEFLDIYPVTNLSLFSNATLDVNDTNLIYNNRSHNSLQINPIESLQYAATNDLFLNSSLQLEEKESYEIGLNTAFRFSNIHCSINATYFNTETKNIVFPIIEDNEFQLENVATIKNSGIEVEFGADVYSGSDGLNYSSSISFSKNRAIVSKLIDNREQIAVAGFLTISKNLIVDESAGVIVGSAYERDENNRVIIGENGFPIVAEETKIIGDPTPDFNLGFNNDFRWRDIELNFTIDAQKGGDVWNGTQNVLNYFGTSQQSATEREITNHIFNGVNQQGEENTIPVDFYTTEKDISENRFVRYGFEGIAEDAIEDGSYLNIKSIILSYRPIKKEEKHFIKDLKIGVYAYNLFTWSKYNGASPYSTLYGNNNGTALNFFNAPLTSEVGLKINIKI